MGTSESIAAAAKLRVRNAAREIEASMAHIQAHRPLAAERDRDRAVQRVVEVTGVDDRTAAQIVEEPEADLATLGLTGSQLRKAEALQGKTVDYVGVAWLEAGRRASDAVARIISRGGAPIGTGFLVSDRLLLTNNHVIESAAQAGKLLAEFRFEVPWGHGAPQSLRFTLDPLAFFQTMPTDDLDFTLVALGRGLDRDVPLTQFGCCPLSDSAVKHSVGEPVNIVQHPDGDLKQVVFRENRIVHRDRQVLHYVADTEGGASGSPVFNDEWQVVALHHWGGPHLEQMDADGRPLRQDVNEGIRISAIVKKLRELRPHMPSPQQRLLDEALRAPPPGAFGTRTVAITGPRGPQRIVDTRRPGDFAHRAHVTIEDVTPYERHELATSAEAPGGAEAARIDANYQNRRGYNPSFLDGLLVPMPQLTARQRRIAARVRGTGTSNPHELKYQHFSVVMNAERKMAFFSICNIDGSRHLRVDRGTGRAAGTPEAAERWSLDPRIPPDAQLNDDFYARVRTTLPRARDFFARGHLTKREDPNWGSATAAERANADTFHHPNGCPQLQNAFNNAPSVWRGIEDYILDAADNSNQRVTVITGPVFADDDPSVEDEELGEVQLPRQFWKIVARVEQGHPKVFAVLADQSEAMAKLLEDRGEATWTWPKRLSREYQSSIAEIAKLTGLDFGDLGAHDERARANRRRGVEAIGTGAAPARRELRSVTELAELLPGDPSARFGRFSSITEFLEAWERRVPGRSTAPTNEGAERKKRHPDNAGGARPQPVAKVRELAEIHATVIRILPDDLGGAMHQRFTIKVTSWVDGTSRIKPDVETAMKQDREVFIAVRFGDSRGLADRVPGIRSGAELHLKGEWISAEAAHDLGGEDLAVLHFTHDPIGFLCTEERCYS